LPQRLQLAIADWHRIKQALRQLQGTEARHTDWQNL